MRKLAALFVFALVLGTQIISAQIPKGRDIITSMSAETLLKMLQSEGYAVSLTSGNNVSWKIDGKNCLLLVAEDQESIQFYVGIIESAANLHKVNQWNKMKKYSRSYIDDDGDPVLELDLDLAGGVTAARFWDFITTCRVSLRGWLDDVVR
jgi:hypothetical protein